MVEKIEIRKTNLDGVTEITAPAWDGKILRMSHAAYQRWRDKGEIPETAATYLLYADHFDKQAYGKELYVGHTGQVDARVDQHVASKPYWSVVLVFVSKNDWMNVAFTQNIEHRFIDWAKLANRYTVMNGTASAETHLGKEDKGRLEAFLADVRQVLRLAGIDVFEFNLDGVYTLEEKFCGAKYKSHMKIEQLTPTKRVRILAGSIINGMNASLVSQAQLVGVSCSADHRVHSFSQDAVVDVDESLSFRIFGKYLTHWSSPCGVSLKEVFSKV